MKEQILPTGIKCPECGQGQLLSFTQNEEFDFDLGDETVKVRAEDVPVEKCDKCGEEMSGPAAARVRHEAICRAAGLLTPSEIKAIRDKFGWSQQYLADLTDFGIATISRWERGRLLQNRANNKVVQAIRDCAPFREYLQGLRALKAKKQEPEEKNVLTFPLNQPDHNYAENFRNTRDEDLFDHLERIEELGPSDWCDEQDEIERSLNERPVLSLAS